MQEVLSSSPWRYEVFLTTADPDCRYSAEKASRKSRGCLCFIKNEVDMLVKDFKVSDFSEHGTGLS